MQDVTSNWTYVVSVGGGTQEGWGISTRNLLLDYGRYFHPYGRGGWPKTPPNYLGFRWGGQLRQVRHVDEYAIVDDLHRLFPQIPTTTEDYVVYTLGPAIIPGHAVPNGINYRNSRLWVALDLLLTSSTIKEALEATKLRQSLG